MHRDNSVSPFPWIAPLDRRFTYPEAETVIGRDEICKVILDTSNVCMDITEEVFGLDAIALRGMNKRMSELRVQITLGRNGEYIPDQEKLDIGPAVQLGSNIVAMAGVSLPEKVTKIDDRVFLSVGGIEEVMKNMHSALDKHVKLIKDNPKMLNDSGQQIIALYNDHERILHTAVSLNFASRLLKYGLVNEEMFSKPQKENIGFDEWLEYTLAITKRTKDYDENEVKVMQDAYSADNIAVKSLHKTIWKEWFYDLFGIDPDQDLGFYVMYYGPAQDKNNKFTIRFNDNRATYLRKETVSHGLNVLYAPKATGLKRIK